MTREEFDIAKSQAKFIPNPEYNEDEDDEEDEFICIEFLGFKVGEIVLITKETLSLYGINFDCSDGMFKIIEIDCDDKELDREWFFYVSEINTQRVPTSSCWLTKNQMRHTKLYKSTNSDEAKSEIKTLVGKVKSINEIINIERGQYNGI